MQRRCSQPSCPFNALKGLQRCGWHWLMRQPISVQIEKADIRLSRATLPYRARVPAAQWPAGARWCAGCQAMIPLFYTTGSRCRACSSRDKRASHVQRTYGLSPTEEAALDRWQGGRCFVCGRRVVKRRLAVDHDHQTGAVRGLLCSDEKHGCNVLLRHLLGDVEAARRLLAYTQVSPIERMRSGEPPWPWAPSADPLGPPPF